MERIQILDDIEKDIITCLQCAGKNYFKMQYNLTDLFEGLDIKIQQFYYIADHFVVAQTNCEILVSAQALLELSKEKSGQKQAETNTSQFLRTLSQVESKLSDQINYLTQVSTGQPHEGSGYASQKVLQMAWHRLEHVRSWVNELDRLKASHLSATRSVSGNVQNGNMTSSSTST